MEEIHTSSVNINRKLKRSKSVLKDKLEIASILCHNCSNYYYRLKTILIIPTLLISSVSFVCNNQDIDGIVLKWINSIVNAITIILIGIQSNLKVVENCDIFKNSSTAFTKLLHELEGQEILEDDIDPKYINILMERYDILISNLPIIPSHIKKQIEEEFGGKKHMPLIVNNLPKLCDDSPITNRSFTIPERNV